jgi:hypothetical protein
MKNKICQSCGTPLPKTTDPDERYFTINEQESYCYDCFGCTFYHHSPAQKQPTYSSGVDKLCGYVDKTEASKYYRDKIAEEGSKLEFLYEEKKQHLKTPDVPDWFLELGLEIINERIAKVQKNIKNLVFKYDILTGARQESKSYRVHDLEAIKSIPITDLMPSEPKMKAPNRLFYSCPIHNEVNPSFVVYLDSNTYYCFGCGKGGDVINLYQELNEVDFKTAVKELSEII